MYVRMYMCVCWLIDGVRAYYKCDRASMCMYVWYGGDWLVDWARLGGEGGAVQ